MERNRKTRSKSSRVATISNSELIKAVAYLKKKSIIKEDQDIATALDYSKAMVSEYLRNNRKASTLFMIRFNEHYFPKKNTSANNNTDVLATIQKQLSEQNTLLKSLIKTLKITVK